MGPDAEPTGPIAWGCTLLAVTGVVVATEGAAAAAAGAKMAAAWAVA
jgi:hypothetical protein